MGYTTKKDVVEVFESTFTERKPIDYTLVDQWFQMAIEEFSVEIEPIEYNFDNEQFVFYDDKGNLLKLPKVYILILGYTIKS